MFNMFAGFVGAFACSWRLDARDPRGLVAVGNVRLGGRHIHHFVPGILIAFGSGAAALITESDRVETTLAVPFGAGVGLDVRRGGAAARLSRRLLELARASSASR